MNITATLCTMLAPWKTCMCVCEGGAQVSLTTGCIPENYRFPAPHHTNDWYYVVTGNKQGCWFRSGWVGRVDGEGRQETWPPFLPTVRSFHWEEIHKEVVNSGPICPNTAIRPLHSQLGRRWRGWAKQIFHSGVMRPQIWAFWHGERFAAPIQACMSTDAFHRVLHLCIHLLILLSP